MTYQFLTFGISAIRTCLLAYQPGFLHISRRSAYQPGFWRGLRVVLLEIHTCCIHYRSSTRMIRSITSAVGPSSCLRLEGASICVYHVCRRESCGPSPLMALDQYCHFRGFFQGQATSSPHPDCSRVFPPDRTRSLRLCPLRLVKERESPDCGSFRPAFPYASLRVFYASSCPWCNG